MADEGPPYIFKIPCCEPGRKPPASVYDRMVTIQVPKKANGDAHELEVTEDFITYRGLLCCHSKYFEKLLTGPFKESGATTYKVTTCTPEVFAMFYNWMNTGIASTRKSFASFGDDSRYIGMVVDLYVFADFHEITALRNHAIEIFFKVLLRWGKGYEYIGEIYERTPEGSALRKLSVDLLVDMCDCKDFERYLGHVTRADLFLDVIKVVDKKRVILGAHGTLLVSELEGWYRSMKEHFCEQYHDHPAPT